MGYVERKKRKPYLMAGFVGMFLCGIGDSLLSFRGDGGETAVGGMMSMDIVNVPLAVYFATFFIGIIAAVGYWLGAGALYSYAYDRLGGTETKLLKTYKFGANMMSLGLFGIHSVCSLAIMSLRSAASAGLSASAIDEYFTVTTLAPFIVTTIWQTAADILAAVGYIGMTAKKQIAVPKPWIICGPLCLFVIFNVLKAFIIAVTGNVMIGRFLSGGETWGLAFMYLSVYFAVNKEEKSNG